MVGANAHRPLLQDALFYKRVKSIFNATVTLSKSTAFPSREQTRKALHRPPRAQQLPHSLGCEASNGRCSSAIQEKQKLHNWHKDVKATDKCTTYMPQQKTIKNFLQAAGTISAHHWHLPVCTAAA